MFSKIVLFLGLYVIMVPGVYACYFQTCSEPVIPYHSWFMFSVFLVCNAILLYFAIKKYKSKKISVATKDGKQ